jgi:Na+/H+ antiporter NhaD/arsenite permease-like protein
LFFFLLVAMTYINAMLERGVFDALRVWLVARGYSYRSLFWLTGILAFFISPVADKLTTALIMCAVVLAVGGLGFIGYLSMASEFIYGELGATNTSILVGIMSAVVDNIPVMFAVLSMNPDMSQVQWLLVTLTAGVGGSLLSIGSAAGVALMGQAKGQYTFFKHLNWLPVIALGYAASIWLASDSANPHFCHGPT